MIDQILSLTPILICVVVAALMFDFVNGWNDSANAIATIVSTRVLSPLKAVILAAVLNLVGAFSGTAVASTITKGLVNTGAGYLAPEMVVVVVLAAMLGAMIWAAWMTLLGLPISGSHSLIGGLCGAAVAAGGVRVLIAPGILKILIAMLISPILGALIAFVMVLAISWLVINISASTGERIFSPLQLLSCSFMAFNHGLNDAQKVMGIITMALLAGGVQTPDAAGEVRPELWVVAACGIMISLGTAVGGWKVIKTLGVSLSKLNPMGGFVAETSASVVLLSAAGLGIPVSTTHTITGAVMGTGLSRGVNSVRWAVGQKIIWAWIFTLPATSILAGTAYWILAVYLGVL